MNCKGHVANNTICTLYIKQCLSCKNFNPKDGKVIPEPLKHGWCIQYVNV